MTARTLITIIPAQPGYWRLLLNPEFVNDPASPDGCRCDPIVAWHIVATHDPEDPDTLATPITTAVGLHGAREAIEGILFPDGRVDDLEWIYADKAEFIAAHWPRLIDPEGARRRDEAEAKKRHAESRKAERKAKATADR